MSWRQQSAFVVKEETIVKNTRKASKSNATNSKFKKLETEILKTGIIDNPYLMINGKEVIITANRLNVSSKNNTFQVPADGPVNINNSLFVGDKTVKMDGVVSVSEKIKSAMNMQKIIYIPIEPRSVLDENDYIKGNHFVVDIEREETRKEIHLMPFSRTEFYEGDHGYIINLCVNIKMNDIDVSSSEDERNDSESESENENEHTYNDYTYDCVDIVVSTEGQDLAIKMESCYSSLSLLWVPQGKWLIHSLGYKTTPIDIE